MAVHIGLELLQIEIFSSVKANPASNAVLYKIAQLESVLPQVYSLGVVCNGQHNQINIIGIPLVLLNRLRGYDTLANV